MRILEPQCIPLQPVLITPPTDESGVEQPVVLSEADDTDGSEGAAGWFGEDMTAVLGSLAFHLVLLVALGLIPRLQENSQLSLTIVSAAATPPEQLELPQQVHFSPQPAEQIGAHSFADSRMALSQAPTVSDVPEIPSPVQLVSVDSGTLELNEAVQVATGLHANLDVVVRGAAGEGVTGAVGAVDRITHEILLSLEERKTLVVWLFDQSGSLTRQRQAIHERLDRIYRELGLLEAAENPAFRRHEDKPLLTAVMAFGNNVTLVTEEPTDDLETITSAVRGIAQDDSGVERVFSAVYTAADRFKRYRRPDARTREPQRNVMLVVFTDEAGDDQNGLEKTVQICRRFAMPVYVVGVPAPFGRTETLVKWVDPDPKYDQSPQWGRVTQGPETFYPERVKLAFSGSEQDDEPIDSGFGPFSLTRLCYETGGIYFAVHPNRTVRRAVSRREVEAFSAHLKHFFDQDVMRRYRPDYTSADEYLRRVQENAARQALLQAAQMSWITPMEAPQLRFVRRSEAQFAGELSEAQKDAARLEPKVAALYEVLKQGEAARSREYVPRWQAGYDLAMGRVLAVKVRTEAFNAVLAQAKRGLEFKNEKNNTWQLTPSEDLSVSSQLEKAAEKARMYLQRVVDEHPETPWALLAQRELEQPMGWKWEEQHTELDPPRNQVAGGGGGAPGAARDDQRRMLEKPKPKRSPPKL